MSYWLPNVPPAVWITIFFILPILFNFFNVRRYGEIEFVLTSIKVWSIVGMIILGLVILGLVSDGAKEPRLATDANFYAIPCVNATGCLTAPGFKSMVSYCGNFSR